MAVTAAVEFDLDTLVGGAVATTELDLDTVWGTCVGVAAEVDERTVAAESEREMEGRAGGWGACVGVEEVDERTVAAEFEREMEGMAVGSWLLDVEGPLDSGDGNWWPDEIVPCLDTEGGGRAPRIVAEELERETAPCAWCALAEEFVLDTAGGPSPALLDDDIVFVLATD
jgi:hypothetical protein